MNPLTRLAGLSLVALAATGCACPGPYQVFDEGFEYCADTCDWTVTGDGAAVRVATIHPGEHGLRLEGAVWLDKPAAATLDYGQSYYDYGGEPTVELVTNCDDGVSVGLAASDAGGYQLFVILPPGPERPPEGGYHLTIQSLARPGVAEDLQAVVDTVTVVNQSGFCVIDELRIVMPAPPCMG